MTKYLIKTLPVHTKRATLYLKSVLRFLILGTCHRTLYVYVSKMWGSVVVLQSQKGSASKNFVKHYF